MNIFDKRAFNLKEMVKACLGPKSEKILDLGCGDCIIDKMLLSEGYNVTSVDVKNKSFVKEIQPIIYDGKTLPFANNSFDTVLLLFVLHHTPDPDVVLREARRVAKKVILLEDIYSNSLQKYFTHFVDSVGNLEFIGHPHSNRDDKGWKETFTKLKFKLNNTKVFPFQLGPLPLTHALYAIQKTA